MPYSFLLLFLKLEGFVRFIHLFFRSCSAQDLHMEQFCRHALAVSHLKLTPPGQRSTDTPVRQKWMPLLLSFFSNPFNVNVPPTQHCRHLSKRREVV